MVSAARGGPLRTQAQDVVELLSDPARCRVILVTLPEELPVSETIESAYTLEDKAGVQLGPVIVNACDPEPVGLERSAAEVAAAAGLTVAPGAPGRTRGGPRLPAGPPRRLGRADRATAPGPAPAPPARAGARRRLHRAGRDRGPGRRAGGRRRRRSCPRGRREHDGRAGTDGAAAAAAERRRPTTLPDLVTERSVVVCCGSGGVGKTTVSATFALAAARAGRRSCVVTVDPARRLADALGVESLPNTPSEVQGDWPGHLYALMLDSKGTFDDLVQRYARTPEQAEVDPGQPALPESRRRALGHPGVHGHGEALRAGRLRGVRHRGRRHAADAQRARPARRARAG